MLLSFLNPWLWLGLAALGGPIWLHLRRRDREKIVYFSAMRFLEDQPIERKPPMQLQHLLLLLLRLLAVLLLVAGFTQPYKPEQSPSISSSLVFVLDNTMSRHVDNGFENDRETILSALQNAGPHSQIAVVEMCKQPVVIAGFGDTPDQAIAKVTALRATNQRGSLLAALREANLLLKQSICESKHITVLSDHQENQWTENPGAPPFLAPDSVTLSPFSSVAERPNFYIAEPQLARLFLGDAALIHFAVLLGHTGPGNSADVALSANGQTVFHEPVQLDPKTDKLTLTKQWACDPTQWLLGAATVTASADDLPLDNTAYFALPPVSEGRVALMSKSVYLKAALSADVVKGHWSVREVRPTLLANELEAPAENDADVLIIDASYLQSADARRLADRYFKNGHGVFITVDRLSTLMTGYLHDLGFTPKSILASSEHSPQQPIRYFDEDSPIFQPFKFMDLSSFMDVRVGDSAELESTQAKALLYGHDGEGLLYTGTKDAGRFLLCTFAFDRNQTDWVIHPSFVPFVDLALQSLRTQNNNVTNLEPGESWLIKIPTNRVVKTVSLYSSTQQVASAKVDENHRATLIAPDELGIYKLTYDKEAVMEQALVVNAPTQESDLHYIQKPPELLTAWTLSRYDPVKQNKPSDQRVTPEQDAAKQNYWWMLLMAGSAMLLCEMVLQVGFVGRKESSP